MHFNIILQPTSTGLKRPLSLVFANKFVRALLVSPCVLHGHCNETGSSVQILSFFNTFVRRGSVRGAGRIHET